MRERIQAGYGYAPGPTEDLHLDRVGLTQALSRLRSEEREAIQLQAPVNWDHLIIETRAGIGLPRRIDSVRRFVIITT